MGVERGARAHKLIGSDMVNVHTSKVDAVPMWLLMEERLARGRLYTSQKYLEWIREQQREVREALY